MLHRDAVHAELALLRIVEARDQLQQGGLAAAAGAHDADPASGRDVEIEIVYDRRLLGCPREGDIAQGDAGLQRRGEVDGVRILGHLLPHVERIGQALQHDEQHRDLHGHLRQDHDGHEEAAGGAVHVEHGSQGHAAAQHQHGAVDQDAARGDERDHVGGAVHGRAEVLLADGVAQQAGREAVEVELFHAFPAVGHDGADGVELLRDEAPEAGVGVAQLDVDRADLLAHGAGEERVGNHGQEHHAGHGGVEREEDHQAHQQHDDLAAGVDDKLHQGGLHDADVGQNARHQAPRRVGEVVAHREADDLGVHILAQAPGDALGHARLQPLHGAAGEVEEEHRSQVDEEEHQQPPAGPGGTAVAAEARLLRGHALPGTPWRGLRPFALDGGILGVPSLLGRIGPDHQHLVDDHAHVVALQVHRAGVEAHQQHAEQHRPAVRPDVGARETEDQADAAPRIMHDARGPVGHLAVEVALALRHVSPRP